MIRSSQLLFPQREPAPARSAATILLLRDSPQGLEVLMTRRSTTASFAPGAFVFPGGEVDASDAAAHGHAKRRPGQGDLHLTQAIAAIRESFEELGVLLARRADGTYPTPEDMLALDREAALVPQCAARGLVLGADEVFVLAHWTTDRHRPRRFDVPFLVARMPCGQSPVADETEQFEPVWVRPAHALQRHDEGGFFMIFPTIRTLQRLQAYGTVDAVLQACSVTEGPLWTSCPRTGLLAGKQAHYMEHEHPYGELQLVSPDGQVVHQLDWQNEQPVRLLKNVMRVTAPNPSAMTGPGTNSYLVGDAATGFIAIDPGPAHAEHLQRLWRAANGDIRMIVCTHSHTDHSPGAKPLQAMCAKPPPILGLPSAATAMDVHAFTPDRALKDHELLVLAPQSDAQTTHSLKVIHTPGHAANHVCLVLVEDGLLFSGDHILNGSTTVVPHPDGNMTAYLDSLDRLAAACVLHRIEFILPAHGHVLGQASAAIAHLKAHRLKREAKVLEAMRSQPEGSIDDWVKLAYDDTPQRLWPVAKLSLLAHVQRIEAMAGALNHRS